MTREEKLADLRAKENFAREAHEIRLKNRSLNFMDNGGDRAEYQRDTLLLQESSRNLRFLWEFLHPELYAGRK